MVIEIFLISLCIIYYYIILAVFSMIKTEVLGLKTSEGPITILNTCKIRKNFNISIEKSLGTNKCSSRLITVIILFEKFSYHARSN